MTNEELLTVLITFEAHMFSWLMINMKSDFPGKRELVHDYVQECVDSAISRIRPPANKPPADPDFAMYQIAMLEVE